MDILLRLLISHIFSAILSISYVSINLNNFNSAELDGNNDYHSSFTFKHIYEDDTFMISDL